MNRTLHLYDWCSYRFDYDGNALFTDLIEPSGYQTLHINLWRATFDPEGVLARAGIRRALSRMGLQFEGEDDLILAAIPPSYNLARIGVLTMRCPELRFELF